MGDEVVVKPGFARNHLIPSKKAVYATPNNQTQHIIEKTVSTNTARLKPRDVVREGVLRVFLIPLLFRGLCAILTIGCAVSKGGGAAVARRTPRFPHAQGAGADPRGVLHPRRDDRGRDTREARHVSSHSNFLFKI